MLYIRILFVFVFFLFVGCGVTPLTGSNNKNIAPYTPEVEVSVYTKETTIVREPPVERTEPISLLKQKMLDNPDLTFDASSPKCLVSKMVDNEVCGFTYEGIFTDGIPFYVHDATTPSYRRIKIFKGRKEVLLSYKQRDKVNVTYKEKEVVNVTYRDIASPKSIIEIGTGEVDIFNIFPIDDYIIRGIDNKEDYLSSHQGLVSSAFYNNPNMYPSDSTKVVITYVTLDLTLGGYEVHFYPEGTCPKYENYICT